MGKLTGVAAIEYKDLMTGEEPTLLDQLPTTTHEGVLIRSFAGGLAVAALFLSANLIGEPSPRNESVTIVAFRESKY